KTGTLAHYCKKAHVREDVIESFINGYDDVKDLKAGSERIAAHNGAYVSRHMKEEKGYLDGVLNAIDENIRLDDEQREVVLSDEDYTLVIAGAGAGKTTTVAAKVKYLVDKKGVDPSEILVVSFTNKAVGELRERINGCLGIKCPIATFHSTGRAILKKQGDTGLLLAQDGFLYRVVNEYFKSTILAQPKLVDKLILFFGSYLDMPYDGNDGELFMRYLARQPITTFKANMKEYNDAATARKERKDETIMDEQVRSREEVRIANFLYLYSVDYVYEETYPYVLPGSRKLYTPDFCLRQGSKTVYLEHFGITETGEHSVYSPEQLERYKRNVKEKIAFHRQHGTRLIYTFSKYKDGRDTLEHLEELLKKEGFSLVRRDSEEVFRKLVSNEENRYIYKMVSLVCNFIHNFKTSDYDEKKFDEFRREGNVREKLFFDICEACYLEYERRLKEQGSIDFQDMINESAKLLHDGQISGEQLPFKYIIVDEYQDISRQRFDLTRELSKLCGAKIIAVGDDWQSIYAFSGSDITLFTHFCEIMGYGREMKITRTYRNAQEVIDIAGSFVQKNPSQITKKLISDKTIIEPVVVMTYSEKYDRDKYKGQGGKFLHMAEQVQKLIERILDVNRKEGLPERSSILLIGRYNFDVAHLAFTNLFTWDEKNERIICNKHRNVNLGFLTAHSAKGLGYDNVIIINASDGVYGFPSKIEDDPIMNFVTKVDRSIEYAEERRLFYVAMTRTKNRVFIMTPETHPSEFVLELLRDYPDKITLRGEIDKSARSPRKYSNSCPVCGFPLQVRYNPNYGLKLWMCANEPEVCNFITNDPSGKKMSIMKCSQCDGYLIVKKSKKTNSYFLGCTNYKEDGTGCNATMSYAEFLRREKLEDDVNAKPVPQESTETQRVRSAAVKSGSGRGPDAAPAKERPRRERIVREIMLRINGDEYGLIATPDGTIMTDEGLLLRLIEVRREIAEEKGMTPGGIVTKDVLVNLATYAPQTMEDFLSLHGTSEKMLIECGTRFIDEIKKYIWSEQPDKESNG
ncbi:MAG: UvrD-helicase domain-containing protein, partial [Bacteroidales bacterium]|nr:UvrD-helicase domain-containing protein [Bacteroidales bacterium]